MIKDPWIIVSGIDPDVSWNGRGWTAHKYARGFPSEDAAERAARKLKKTDKTKLCSRHYIGHWHERVGPNAA
jgi:hypothetical protein